MNFEFQSIEKKCSKAPSFKIRVKLTDHDERFESFDWYLHINHI